MILRDVRNTILLSLDRPNFPNLLCRGMLIELSSEYVEFCRINLLNQELAIFEDIVSCARTDNIYEGVYSSDEVKSICFDTSGETEEVGRSFLASMLAVYYANGCQEELMAGVHEYLDHFAGENALLVLGVPAIYDFFDYESLEVEPTILCRLERYVSFCEGKISEEALLRF
jgi:hypothetical protein